MKSLGAKTLLYPAPVLVVGSYDKDGKPNIMTAAWGGICCSKPPCVTISLRQATYTYGNLMDRKAYTLNIPSRTYAAHADHAGLVSGRTEDKFATLGLTPVKSDLVDAPYIAEFPMVLECKVINTVEIGLHTQFIGEIMDVKVQEECLSDDGKADPVKVDPLAFAPESRQYFALGEMIGKAFSIGKK